MAPPAEDAAFVPWVDGFDVAEPEPASAKREAPEPSAPDGDAVEPPPAKKAHEGE